MDRVTVSKLGKECAKAVYCHPTYLTYMQGKTCEMVDWMNHKLKSRLQGKKSAISDIQNDATLMAESKE